MIVFILMLLGINVLFIDCVLCKFVKMFKDFDKMSQTIEFDFYNEN